MKTPFSQPIWKRFWKETFAEPEHQPLRMSWILPGRLAVGGLPRSQDIARLQQAQVQVVLSLCAETEGCLPAAMLQTFHCQRWVLPDSHYRTPLEVNQLAIVVQQLHQSLSQGQPVYIHCLAGMERSPTVCIAYLMQHHRLPLWEAMNYVKQAHPTTRLAEVQLSALQQFERLINQAGAS